MPGRLPDHVSKAFLPHPPRVMGVAVSGGSDSMALLYLMQEFCAMQGIELYAVTVNHGLRPEAAEEARMVAAHCEKLQVPHDTLVWEDWSGEGNLQKAARDARYRQMAEWAGGYDINTIAVGHTANDQAETMLMRLSRSAGVDGLSGMAPRSLRDGITWVRPFLQTKRETLQEYLRERDIGWISDPSNDDERFDRIKARRALRYLSELGIDEGVLAEVSDHLGKARRALEWQTFLAAKQIVTVEAGALVLQETGLRLQPDEIQRRLMVRAISWISGSEYPPRRAALAHVMSALRRGQAGTLDGCHIRRIAARFWVFREFNAVEHLVARPGALWDNQWILHGPDGAAEDPDLEVRALGMAGLDQCPDWRATGRPHVVLQSSPSVWRGDQLVSAPLAGHAQGWEAELVGGPDRFFAELLSH